MSNKIPRNLIALALLLLTASLMLGQGSGFNASSTKTFTGVGTSSLPIGAGIGWHQLAWTVTGAPVSCTVTLDSSSDGSIWIVGGVITGQSCLAAGNSTVVNITTNFVRVNVASLSAGATITVTYTGWAYNPSGGGGGGSIGGSGSINSLPKFVTNTTTLGNSLYSDDGTNGAYAGASFYVGSPDPSCGTATGCIGIPEGGTSGTPTTGHFYMRPDSGTHALMMSKNGSAEQFAVAATNSGQNGQPCLSTGAGDGSCVYADPAISINTVTLLSSVSATGTQTSSSTTNPLRGGTGVVTVFASGITGSPTGCTINLFFAQAASLQTDSSAFATITLNSTGVLANGYVKYPVTSTSQGDNIVAVYACSGYPGAGLITVSGNFAMPIGASSAPIPVNLSQMAGNGLSSPCGAACMPAGIMDATPNGATVRSGGLDVNLKGSSNLVEALSVCNVLSAASTNAVGCDASPGNFYGYEIYNTTTTVYYLRLYNLATAPTCSSSTGFIRSIPLVPGASAGLVGGAVSNQVYGVNYSTGIAYCITGGSTSTDNTNAAVGIFGEIRYK